MVVDRLIVSLSECVENDEERRRGLIFDHLATGMRDLAEPHTSQGSVTAVLGGVSERSGSTSDQGGALSNVNIKGVVELEGGEREREDWHLFCAQ